MRALRLATLDVVLIAAVALAADGAAFAQEAHLRATYAPPMEPARPFVPAADATVVSQQASRPQEPADAIDFPELLPASSSQAPLTELLPSERISITPLPSVSGHDRFETGRMGRSDRNESSDFAATGVGFGAGRPCLPHESGYNPATSPWLHTYERRIAEHPHQEGTLARGKTPEGLPPGFQPWWNAEIAIRLRGAAEPLTVTVDSLVVGALQYSPLLLAVEAETESRQQQIVVADAEFDCRSFIESKYDDNSDPVGNLLTTGGAPRFRDQIWTGSAGYRRKTRRGGEWELAQHLGFQDNNSRFFVPDQQGTTRLEISFTQPLLSRAGLAYNSSRIVLAEIDANLAEDELHDSLLDHLLKVNGAYWELYRVRAIYLQKQRLLKSAASILELLEARAHVDAVHRQILRARAAVASRRSEIARAGMSIRNAESQLRLLVNDPQLAAAAPVELIPRELPLSENLGISMSGSLQTALGNRPDISQAIREMRAAGVRLNVARNEMLPKLDMILSTYVAGLEGESRIGSAFGDQFSEGEPGYSAGFVYEFPLGNRAARTRFDRRQLEANKALFEFQATVEAGLTDVELAVREVDTSYREIGSTFQAMHAAEDEAEYLDERWRLLPGPAPSTTQLLEDLLDAQERLADEEAGFVIAQVDYAMALANLKRSTGILLRFMDDGPCQDGANQATSTVPAQRLIESAVRRPPAISG